MITLNFIFWMYIALGSFVGAMRGWAKELLVAFSAVLALFIITVMETYVGSYSQFVRQGGPKIQFWAPSVIIMALAYFGYQTPNFKILAAGAVREKLQDSLLGFVLGGVNGYLIFGSLWFFMHKAGYPFNFIFAPDISTVGESGMQLLTLLPPVWLTPPGIYFAVAIAFTFVVIVFV
ncbi:MAG: CvpA family protein [Anaerolineae bacterium]|nr:CvpA family protein [Anaerolineae bacterium]